MSRVKDRIDSLQTARDEILKCLADGPQRTGDILEKLGYSGTNFVLTKMIGDERGEWDDSPHQLAQSDMIEDGTLVWWRDDVLDVWYGFPSQCPYPTHGDDSPICKRLGEYLDTVCMLVSALPHYDEDGNDSGQKADLMWSAPFITVREIDGPESAVSVSVEFPNGKGIVELSEYDFVVGAGNDEPVFSFPWPDTSPQDVAAKIPEALEIIRQRWNSE